MLPLRAVDTRQGSLHLSHESASLRLSFEGALATATIRDRLKIVVVGQPVEPLPKLLSTRRVLWTHFQLGVLVLVEAAAEKLDDAHILDCNHRMVRAVVEQMRRLAPEAGLDG